MHKHKDNIHISLFWTDLDVSNLFVQSTSLSLEPLFSIIKTIPYTVTFDIKII